MKMKLDCSDEYKSTARYLKHAFLMDFFKLY